VPHPIGPALGIYPWGYWCHGGKEKCANTALTTDVDTFVVDLLAGLEDVPAYYAHMGPANAAGPAAGTRRRPARRLSAAIGTGLIFSAATNTCGMAAALAELPHNQPRTTDLHATLRALRNRPATNPRPGTDGRVIN
jgi:hypothetical protein